MTTSFIDSLTTIDINNSNGLGSNWIQGTVAPNSANNNVNGAAAKIAVATKDGLNCLAWQGFGISNPLEVTRAYAIPIPTYFDVRGQSQYVKCTNIKLAIGSDSSELTSGLMVQFYGSTNTFNGYMFQLFPTSGRGWRLYRANNTIFTLLNSGTEGVDGDIWKLSSDLSNSSQVTLIVSRNGSTLVTYIDTSSSRLNYGSPSLYCQFDNNGAIAYSEWRTFSCGIGL